MKISKNGDRDSLARLAQTAPGQAPVQEGGSDSDNLSVPTSPRSFQDMRGDAVRDNDAVQKVIAEAGKKLGYGCMVMTIERTPDTNSHYMIFFSKKVPRPAGQAYAGFPGGTDEIKITFDIPSFGLVKGELDHGPDWIEPEKKLALIRDIMKVAADGKELAALPMSQEINVNSMVARQLGVAQNLAGGIHGRNT